MGPVSVLDVQLAFSPSKYSRFGMGRMLEHVPQALVDRLPEKDQIDWDASHSLNRRALQFPLLPQTVTYAIDDLHRIEAILRSQAPSKPYREALQETKEVLIAMGEDPYGLISLKQKHESILRSHGKKQIAVVVEVMRHIISLELRGVDIVNGAAIMKEARDRAAEHLLKVQVTIPPNLAFHDDAQSLRSTFHASVPEVSHASESTISTTAGALAMSALSENSHVDTID